MPVNKGQTITVGVTGASGAVFAQKTLAMLEEDPRVGRIHLVVTETGQRLFSEELRITSGDLKKLPGRILGRTPKKIEVISNKDVGASIASGSYSVDAMIDPPWAGNCTTFPANCRQSALFTIHGISHGIGLAVHDPAQFYSGDRTFKVGDAFTIEPGIYVSSAALATLPDTPRNRAFIAKVRNAVTKYENTGVRIEDDYVITEQGTERISTAPREIPEIEALMKQRARPVVP